MRHLFFSLFVFILYLFSLPLVSHIHAQYPTPTPTQTPTPTPTQTPTPTPIPLYTIQAVVYRDTDRSGTYNAGDVPLQTKKVYKNFVTNCTTGTQSNCTDANGTAVFDNLTAGSYTISYVPDSGYTLTAPTSGSYNVPVGPNTTVYFGVTIPPTPTFTPNPPTTSCTGNNPTMSFSWSSPGAVWFNVYNGDNVLVQSGSQNNYTGTNPPSDAGRPYYYTVRAYYISNPSFSTPYSSATTAWFLIPDCYYSISGNVFVDNNRDGSKNGNDTNYGNASLSLTGQPSGTTNGSGNFSFGSLLGGNYTLTLTNPVTTSPNNTYAPTTPNPARYQFTPLAGTVTTANFGIVPVGIVPTITVTPGPDQPTPTSIPPGVTPTPAPAAGAGSIVFLDFDRSATYTLSDTLFPGATIRLTGTLTYGNPTFTSQTATTNNNGTYTFPNPATSYLYEGTYTTTLITPATAPGTNPARYRATTATSKTFPLPPNATGGAFGMVPLYQISGNVFDDRSKDGIKTGAEPNMTAGAEYTVEIRGPVNLNLTTTNGAYITGPTLYEGQYTVTYTSTIPTGYQMTNPANCVGNCSFTVTVGRNCTVNSTAGASCTSAGFPFVASDVQNLNFGMTNYIPWEQCIGNSCSLPIFTDPIPDESTITCPGGANASLPGTDTNTPGIIFSGGSIDLGQGQASTPENWVVVDYTYDMTIRRTSYGYMTTTLRQSGITPRDLADECTLSNCTLPADLANAVYLAESNVVLNAYTFPLGKNYVILVNGDLRINGAIRIPPTSAVTFSVAGSITIDSDLGTGIGNFCSLTPSVEGFFSTDESFIVEGINDCTLYSNPLTRDQRLNVAGAIVVNAAGTGGSFQNQRDLCDDNLKAPSFSIIARPDFLLNAPEFIKFRSDVWREVAP